MTFRIYFLFKKKPTTRGMLTLPLTKIAEFAILKATESLCLVDLFHNEYLKTHICVLFETGRSVPKSPAERISGATRTLSFELTELQ